VSACAVRRLFIWPRARPLWRAAAIQLFVEVLVDFVDTRCATLPRHSKLIAPLALTIFCWILLQLHGLVPSTFPADRPSTRLEH
jgi:F0F1-type ATP synthase membrane subunit a